MLSAMGFIMIALIIILLLKEKMSPVAVMVLIPTLAAFIVGTGINDLSTYVKDGMDSIKSNAFMFIFSILFFGIMSDVGVFDALVDKLAAWAADNPVKITVSTALIATIAHLDGSAAATLLITVPAMLPIYRKMGMRSQTLLTIIAASVGVMNLLPWGGPTVRAATVIGMDPTDMWRHLIPIQILGVVLSLTVAVILGIRERKYTLANGNVGISTQATKVVQEDTEKKASSDPRFKKLLPVNIILTIGIIGLLMANKVIDLPSYYIFMLGTVFAMVINFPNLKEQNNQIKKHAASALSIVATIMAAGVMVGIMEGTGMLDAMAQTLIGIIPQSMGKYIHIIFGILGGPLGMITGTDAYFYGILPPLAGVGEAFGVKSIYTALAMILGKNCILLLSPMVPATWLGLGLFDEEITLRGHIKASFAWCYGISLIMLIFGIVFGIIAV
ncbi:CitMHS family transporter [Anaerococcus urinomassiliensis]|uniref:CitMHS family transporter n=1 Tax=Anaerococcus urinomassiliensis TaxID=1745712 RepID=UPI00093A4CD1|nr:citrate:proton symporter [Anaerococcus urinomassiliensis]